MADLGNGVILLWDSDGQGFMWKHPKCRAGINVRFKTGSHKLIAGGPADPENLTLTGTLRCHNNCGTRGQVINGKWVPE